MQTTVAIADPSARALPRLSWRRLLILSTAADLVAILVVAAIISDPEAAAVGIGFGVGWALLRWRRGLAGRVVLGLLFVDVLAWMSLGAVTNIRGGERWARSRFRSGEVTVELVNRDVFWHTFTIDELGVDLAVPVNGDRHTGVGRARVDGRHRRRAADDRVGRRDLATRRAGSCWP